MCDVDLSTREGDGRVIVVLRGELDVAAAAGVAAALTAVAASEPRIIVDLAGLRFIDASGVGALVRGRNQARRAGGELLLAAPGRQVLRVLTITRLIDAFPVHASVDEAASSAGRSRQAAVLAARPPVLAVAHDPGPAAPRAARCPRCPPDGCGERGHTGRRRAVQPAPGDEVGGCPDALRGSPVDRIQPAPEVPCTFS
jgi:anti-sigma B factor antagonist